MDNWKRLEILLEQNQFELINFKNITPYKDGTDCRLIYLMNDSVESFLVFRNVRYTGEYKTDYEGNLEYVLSPDENCIRIHQGNSCLLLFFDELDLETHLYNYGEIGHFWLKGNEDLRIIEYQISIIADKLTYLGKDACNIQEQALAALKHFPPLNYTCYPSASTDYVIPLDNPWAVSSEALSLMEHICMEAKDEKMYRLIHKYRISPSVHLAKKIARCLSYSRHYKVPEILRERIRQAAEMYPNRSFGRTEDLRIRHELHLAYNICHNYKKRKISAWIYREEPFIYDCDDIKFGIYILIIQKGVLYRKTKVFRLEPSIEGSDPVFSKIL